MRYFGCFGFIFFLFIGCKNTSSQFVDYRLIAPINADSTANMVVEIPAGTTAKFEMNKNSYTLVMDSIEGQPRFINYLGYPGNYGMIPNTVLLKNEGGDGDPLDILLLGPAVERGSVQKVRIIGVLELLDNGEKDDKLIAVNPLTSWSKVNDIVDLDTHYPGTKTIVATFFKNYKGQGEMQLKGWSDRKKAMQILQSSIQSSKN